MKNLRKQPAQGNPNPAPAASDSDSLSFMGNSDSDYRSSPLFIDKNDRPDKDSPIVFDEGASYDIAMNSPRSGIADANNNAFQQQLRHLQEPRKQWEDGMELEVTQIAEELAAAIHIDDQPVTVRVHTNEDFQDYVDPLGFGVVNPATLALERGSGTEGATTRLSRKKLEAVRISSMSPTKKQTMSAAVDKLLTSSPHFEPWLYLGSIHSNTSKEELKQGAQILQTALNQRTGQLRQLVKENFPRFIGCKSTIDDIHLKLQENEAFGTSGSTQLVGAAIVDAGEEASKAFSAILERQAEADSVKNKLQLLQRFEALFKMPTRVTQLAEERNFEQVVSEYRRARALIPRGDHELWEVLFQRVESNVTAMQTILMAELADPAVTLEHAATAIHNVELLKAEGLPSAQRSSPLTKLRECQLQHMEALLDGMQVEHEHVLRLVASAESLKRRSNAPVWQLPGDEARAAEDLVQDHAMGCTNEQLARLDFLKELARFCPKHASLLAELQSSQALSDLYRKLGHKEEWRSAVKAIKKTLTQVIEKVQGMMYVAVEKLWKLPDPGMHAHMSAIQILGQAKESVMAPVGGASSWPALLEMFESLAMGVLNNGVESLARSLADEKLSTFEWEKWRTTPEVAGANIARPVSPAMSTLNHRICTIMGRFHSLTETARTRCLIMLTDAHTIICEAFFQQMALLPVNISSMLAAVRKDSSKELKNHEKGGKLFTVQQGPGDVRLDAFWGGAGDNGADKERQRENIFYQPMDSPVKALSLLTTCAYLADHLVMHLTKLHLPLLCSDSHAEKEACLEKAAVVVDQLVGVREQAKELYVNMQGALLKASVKHYLTTDGTLWESVPITRNLRNAVFDMVYAIVLVMHQVTSHAPLFTQQLMGDLVLIVVVAIEEHMRGSGLHRVGAAGLATFFLEISFIETTIPKMLKSYAVDEKLDICYENILMRLLDCIRDQSVTQHPSLQKVLKDMITEGTEDEMLKSLHDCLVSLATKVLPALTQKAQLHTQCFKALQESSNAAAGKPSRKSSHNSQGAKKSALGGTRSGPAAANLEQSIENLMNDLNALDTEDIALAM